MLSNAGRLTLHSNSETTAKSKLLRNLLFQQRTSTAQPDIIMGTRCNAILPFNGALDILLLKGIVVP